MSIAKRIGLTLLLLPLAEIAAFVLVAIAVGVWAAALLVLLTSVAGALLLRLGGRAHLERVRGAIGGRLEVSAEAAGRGVFIVLAGLLLLIPGFLTDILGLLILLPATRRRIGSLVNRSLAAAFGGPDPGPSVVDLDPDEWQRHPDEPPRGRHVPDKRPR